MKTLGRGLWWVALGWTLGCGGGSGGPDGAQAFIAQYAAIVRASYGESLEGAKALRTAVDALVASPNVQTLSAARQAWLDSREPYGQTEVYRFYNGPIDGQDGPEGRINSWPLDEAFIDYVEGNSNAGVINDPTTFPTLSKQLLSDQNQAAGETQIATGYHAVEFLLWGQDQNPSGPGARPHTDYLAGGTAENQARRGQYLRLAAELLVEDLTTVNDAWATGQQNYAADLQALDATEALSRILQGMGGLSGAELSGERMTVAYDNKDQEDEHSCFSDNTHHDLYNNALGIQNVYLGRFGNLDGPGLDELVAARDAALDTKMKEQLSNTLLAIQNIPAPFDQTILGSDSDPGRTKVLAAIRALQAQTETLVEIATMLGVQLNLE